MVKPSKSRGGKWAFLAERVRNDQKYPLLASFTLSPKRHLKDGIGGRF